MRRATILVLALSVLGAALPLGAADTVRIVVIVHPGRHVKLRLADLRAIYLKEQKFWKDGRPVVPVNRDAGSDVRESFSRKVFGQDSRELAAYWNRRYFLEGEFPPATLASDRAVVRFVAGNPNAIGYVARKNADKSVRVALTLK